MPSLDWSISFVQISLSFLQALLNNGADPSIESEKEGSPLDLAKKIDPNLVALLNVRPAVQDDVLNVLTL